MPKSSLPRLTQEEQLENTLLQSLYPGIRVARLNVPPGSSKITKRTKFRNR